MTQPDKITELSLTCSVDIEAAKSEGKRPTFSMLAYSGEPMRVGGYYSPVIVDLDGLRAESQTLPILFNHDQSRVLGQAESIEVGQGGVRLSGRLTADDEDGHRVVSHAKNGFRWQASIGSAVIRSEFLQPGQKATVNGRQVTGPMTIARESILKETSIVSIGADSKTSTSIAAKRQGNHTQMEPNQTTNEPTDQNHDDTLKAERERCASIAKIAAKHPGIQAQAMTEGWDANRTELEVLRASRKSTPYIHTGAGPASVPASQSADILAAAVLHHAGRGETAAKLIGEEAANQASDLRCRSLLDICASAVQMSTGYVPTGRVELVKAAFSTSSLPVALGDAASKIALEAFEEAPATWRSFCRKISVSNFKEQSLVRPLWNGGFSKVGSGGELKHGQVAELTHTLTADTFGELITLTRRQVINDDLSLFDGASEAMGRAGARVIADEVYTALLENAGSFFSAGNGNYISGADSSLSFAGLDEAVAAMMRQTDPEDKPLDMTPRTLLVPVELNHEAKQLTISQNVDRYTSSGNDNRANGNPYYGMLTPVAEPRLSNTTFTGNSSKAWYLFARPQDGPIVIGFLDGREQPMIESVDLPADTLGVGYRAYIDFGLALGEPRAALKSKGEA